MVESSERLGMGLEGLEGHVERADAWARESLRAHPGLSSVSVQLGVEFGLAAGVTLTWNRSAARDE